MSTAAGLTLEERLEHRGISRRRFMTFCGSLAVTLALPRSYGSKIAEALGQVRKPVMIWREFSDCAGNSEAMLRAPHPTIAELVLDTLSLDYHELIMAGAGEQAEEMSAKAVEEHKGAYLAVIEGAIPRAAGGAYCTIGGRSAIDICKEVVENAAATIAVGACAFDGGIVRSGPTDGVGVQEIVPGAKVVNLSGCPHNPANTAAVLAHYLTFKELPALDRYNRPLFAHGDLIHDQCERRAYFDAGLFVEEWGDEGHRKGYCLYKMGCKGPQATFNCPNVRWNDGTSWPVQAGHGCIACASPNFFQTMTPFYGRLEDVPGFGADTTAEKVGIAVVAAVTGASAVHGVAKAIDSRRGREQTGFAGDVPNQPVPGGAGAPTEERPAPGEDR